MPYPYRLLVSIGVGAVELIPRNAATEAEVLPRSGAVPGVTEHQGPWVVLRGEDWPMGVDAARGLAAALMRAADPAESAADRLPHPNGRDR